MKDIGLAAEHYQIMKESLRKAQNDCEESPTIARIHEETIAKEKLWVFETGLDCAGILEEVEEEWRKRHEHN